MFTAQMLNIIKSVNSILKSCKIFVGRNPVYIYAPAIIFFPLMPFQLNCGFAGLMTFKIKQKLTELTADIDLEQLWEKIRSRGLKNVLDEKIAAEGYLNGLVTLESMENTVLELKSESAQETLFFQTKKAKKLLGIIEGMKLFITGEEKLLEANSEKFISADLEIINSRIILLKDIQWSLEKDILSNFGKIIELSGADETGAVNPASFKKYRKINFLLNSLDRLEVRGRDSAGLQIVFAMEKEETLENIIAALKEEKLYKDYLKRSREGDLVNGSIWIAPKASSATDEAINVTFTYKTFSIVGELGRNVRDLRQAIQQDRILQCFAAGESVCETVLTHTRWASVGSITEENCHPVNNHKTIRDSPIYSAYSGVEAQIYVVLNG